MYSEHLPEPTVEQNHLTQSLFYNKVLTSYVIYKTILKVRTSMVIWVQTG